MYACLWGQEPKMVLPIGHTGRISSTSFSPDYRRIITVGDVITKIWDAESGAMLFSLNEHRGWGTSCAQFSHDGKCIITSDKDRSVRTWDAATGILISHFEQCGEGFTEFSPDDSKFVTVSGDTLLKYCDVITGALIFEFKAHKYAIQSVEFSPDGTKIVTSSWDNSVKVWDLISGKLLYDLRGHTDRTNYGEFSHDGKTIVSTSEDNTAKIWSVETGALLKTLKGHFGFVQFAHFSSDDKKIVTAGWDNSSRIWSVASGELLVMLKGHRDDVNCCEFNLDDSRVLTASDDGTIRIWDALNGTELVQMVSPVRFAYFNGVGNKVLSLGGTVSLWNGQTGRLLLEFRGHTTAFDLAKYNDDSKRLVTVAGGTTKLWDLGTGELVGTFVDRSAVTSVEFSVQGDQIITGMWNGSVKIWDANTGVTVAMLQGHSHRIGTAQFSADGKRVVTTTSSTYLDKGESIAKIWDAITGKCLFILTGHTDCVPYACFSPDGTKIATVSDDMTAKIWEVNTGKELFTLVGHTDKVVSAKFSPDGKSFYTCADDRSIRTWDCNTGIEISDVVSFAGGYPHVQFSDDGQKILSMPSFNNYVEIGDVKTGKMITQIHGHSDYIISSSFVGGGNKIITTSKDNTIGIWDIGTGKSQFTFIAIDSSDYLIRVPAGYYQCSPNAARFLHYITPAMKVVSFEQLDVKYNRPDIVAPMVGKTNAELIESYHQAWLKRVKKIGIDTSTFASSISVPTCSLVDEIKYEQNQNGLKVHLACGDELFNMDHINIWINDCPLWGQKGIDLRSRNVRDFDTTFEIILSAGVNRLETSVMNTNGIESYRSPVYVNYTPEQPITPKTYFVGIGADRFSNPRYNLSWSTKDIRDQCSAMQLLYGDNFVLVDTLFNEKVTVENVQALKAKLMNTTVNDRVIVAYSGHGLLSSNYDYYLSTYNVNFHKPEEGGLAYEELENLVDRIPARQKLMLIDACHSGEVDKEEMLKLKKAESDTSLHLVTNGKGIEVDAPDSSMTKLGAQNSFELMSTLFVNVSRGTGTTVIAAASGTQFAYENGTLKNGVFTYCFLETMRTEKTCTVQQMKTKVSTRVTTLTNGLQRPTSRTETSGYDWRLW